MKVIIATVALLAILDGYQAQQNAPYPPSGWRPSGKQFNPAPQRVNAAQYGAPPQKYDVEVTRERVVYAGEGSGADQGGQGGQQQGGYPASQYGPPPSTTTEVYDSSTTDNEGLMVQGLPSTGTPPTFRKQRIQVSRKALRQQYGSPTTVRADEEDQTTESVTMRDQEELENREADDEQNAGPSMNVANAFANGQYYVLLPNNQLQRVMYEATQSREEQQKNGFSAQLKYQNVEPIRDPIYSYNSLGQLVRIYK